MADGAIPGVLLTTAHVLLWKEQREEIARRYEAAKAELAAADKRIEAVSLLLDDGSREILLGIKPPLPEVRPEPTLRDFILETLNNAQRGMTASELMGEVKNSEYRDALLSNSNAVYAVVERLARKGDIRKRKGLNYSRAIYAKLERGEIEDVSAQSPEAAPIYMRLITEIVQRSSVALPPYKIIDLMSKHRDFADRVKKNKQYAYSMLARMVERGILERDENGYRIASHNVGGVGDRG